MVVGHSGRSWTRADGRGPEQMVVGHSGRSWARVDGGGP